MRAPGLNELVGHRWRFGRGKALTLRVLDDARDLALHDGDGRVCGSEIDTDDRALDLLLTLGGSGGLISGKL